VANVLPELGLAKITSERPPGSYIDIASLQNVSMMPPAGGVISVDIGLRNARSLFVGISNNTFVPATRYLLYDLDRSNRRLTPVGEPQATPIEFSTAQSLNATDVILLGTSAVRYNISSGDTAWTFTSRLQHESSLEDGLYQSGQLAASPDGRLFAVHDDILSRVRVFDADLGLPMGPWYRLSESYSEMRRIDIQLDNNGDLSLLRDNGHIAIRMRYSEVLDGEALLCAAGVRIESGRPVLQSLGALGQRCGFAETLAAFSRGEGAQ